MATPPRLVPLLEQFDWACARLDDRIIGPDGDSGNGLRTEIPAMTDEEYRWVPGLPIGRGRESGHPVVHLASQRSRRDYRRETQQRHPGSTSGPGRSGPRAADPISQLARPGQRSFERR
jgi:hypothetical protein